MVVSRKVSKSAVVRNRIRRRIFELLRAVAGRIDGPYDVVCTVYAESVATLPAEDLQRIIMTQLDKAAVLKPSVSGEGHAIVKSKESV